MICFVLEITDNSSMLNCYDNDSIHVLFHKKE